MKIEVFGKPGCGRCESTKRKLSHYLDRWGIAADVEIVSHDMESVDGRAEGAFRDVDEVPTVIVSDGEAELARWQREMFSSDALKDVLTGEKSAA